MAKQTTQTRSSRYDFSPQGPRMREDAEPAPAPRLRAFYADNVAPALQKQFNYKSTMQTPKLEKITLNMGVGDAVQDVKNLQNAVNELELISGQRPVITRAKNSISNFKLREQMPIGCMVTLRSNTMFEFLDRFINITSPRIRDFRGFSDKSFDGRGNYSLGIKEQIVFPEIDVDKVSSVRGLNITFVTTAETDEEGYALLKEFGFPFRRKNG